MKEKQQNKSFIKIPHSLFTIQKNELNEEIDVSKFKQFGTEGFTIWSYLLYTQGNQISAQTTIKRITSFLNRNKQTRAKKAKNGLNDTRTIKKYLNVLHKMNMIQIEEFTDDIEQSEPNNTNQNKSTQTINNNTNNIPNTTTPNPNNNYFASIRSDEELFLQVNDMDDGTGFSIISSQLFFDYVHRIGHIGWSIYCLLFKNHNINFGNQNEDEYSMKNYGFANCSEEYISKILNRSRSTISEYINNIPTILIKILPQESTTWTDFKSDTTVQTYMPNHYIVNAKYNTENKYYIETKSKD